MSQLAAQLSRPITITSSSSLPSYTQALADQAQVKAAQSSPRPRLLGKNLKILFPLLNSLP